MKTAFLYLAIILLPLISFSQSKFSSGLSMGLISIDKENGLNENFYIGYNTSKNITIGIDGMISKIDVGNISVKTNSVIGYIEAGVPDRGIVKGKLYFSGILGLGYIEQKNDFFNVNAGCFFAGTKFNYLISPKIVLGIKSGYYISKLDNAIIANLFCTYKF